jgi:hypothetical protein
VDHALNLNPIVKEFKRMDARRQTTVLITTDYAAFWNGLREHYLGPLDLMDAFLDEWDAQKRSLLLYDRSTFEQFYPALISKIREIDVVARLMK